MCQKIDIGQFVTKILPIILTFSTLDYIYFFILTNSLLFALDREQQ